MRSRPFWILALLLAPAAAQTPPPQPPPAEVAAQDADITFQSRVNEVLVPVVVRDKSGKPVAGLTKDDFQLFDRGRLQSISRIAVETAEPKPLVPATPAAKPNNPAKSGDASAPNVLTPGHFTAFFFDDVHIEFPDLVYARDAAIKYLADGLKESDRAAIFTTSGQINVEFTDDIAKLKDALGRLRPRPVARSLTQNCPDLSYYMADLIIEKHDPMAINVAEQEAYICLGLAPPQTLQDTESMVMSTARSVISAGEQETRIALGSLRDLVRIMGAAPGQRLILMVSPGFQRTTDESEEMSDIVNRAIKANVTISALDARGLYTDTPDISKRTISIAVEQLKQQYARASSRSDADVMAELADATGGTFFQNNNDLGAGIRALVAVPEVYYILAFSPQNLKLDGGYHALKVTLRNKPGDSAKSRRGYYAPRHLESADEEAKEEISQALFSRDDLRDIPIQIHTQFFKPTDDETQLSVITRIDVRKLHYRKVDGRNGDELLVVVGLFDHNGNFLQNVSRKVSMKLKDDTLAGKLDAGIALHADFKTAPGRYIVRLVVRDAEGQMMAAQSDGVEIP